MSVVPKHPSQTLARASLTLAIALTLGLPAQGFAAEAPSPSPTSTITVANCNDNGSGSLRAAVANAFDGDTIDLTHLTCSTISLSTGELSILRNNLTIKGRGPASTIVAVDSGFSGRVFRTNQSLTLTGMTVSGGNRVPIGGGCVFAYNLTLDNVHVDRCSVRTDASDRQLKGGAVYTTGKLTMRSSSITGSWIDPHNQQQVPRGCGVYATLGLDMADSEISENHGDGKYHANCDGGGAFVTGTASISGSTIDHNEGRKGAGLYLLSQSAQIANSTLSANYSYNNSTDASWGSAIYSAGPVALSNSTIAFTNDLRCAVFLRTSATMQSVIISNNNAHQDICTSVSGTPVTGSNNLATNSAFAPPDTLTSDPLLLPLAYNGGKTRTHALAAGSPAIDHGNNVLNLAWDQRGAGFPRMVGAAPDIGAFESPGDLIFRNGFERP